MGIWYILRVDIFGTKVVFVSVCMKLLYATAAIQGLPEPALKTQAEEELLPNRTRGKMHLLRAPQKEGSLDERKQGCKPLTLAV